MKSPLFFRSLIGFAFLVAGGFVLCAETAVQQVGFPVIIGVNTTFDATSGADDAFPGDGQCETAVGNGVCTLRAAIEEANAHAGSDGIFFDIPTSDSGYSNGTWTIKLSKALPNITDSVNINGPGAGQLIVFNNIQNVVRIFDVTTTGAVNISGLTISGGSIQNGNGAGIQNASTGTVNITNCTLTNNECLFGASFPSGLGGAIYNATTGTVNITSSLLTGNSATDSGGAIFNSSGTVTIATSALRDNTTSITYNSGRTLIGGGGIFSGGTLTVTNSTITNNSSVNGGGIFINGPTTNITGTTVSGNFADAYADNLDGSGGGIYVHGGRLNLANSTISGNSGFGFYASVGGGGIFNYIGNLAVTNSTIANNSVFGPGVFFGGGGISNDSSGSVTVKSTIIAMNSAEVGFDVAGAFTSAGFNLIGKKDGSTGFTAATDKHGTIASPLNPRLDPKGLRSNGGPTQTIALVAGSPAIDKGTSVGLTGTLTTDQRGFARTVDKSGIPNANGGDGTDIGAYEFGSQ